MTLAFTYLLRPGSPRHFPITGTDSNSYRGCAGNSSHEQPILLVAENLLTRLVVSSSPDDDFMASSFCYSLW